jgi:hypothetical protein
MTSPFLHWRVVVESGLVFAIIAGVAVDERYWRGETPGTGKRLIRKSGVLRPLRIQQTASLAWRLLP